MKISVLALSALAALLFFSAGIARADSCVSTACHPDIAAFKQLHAPVRGGDCLSCHIQRIKEHPAKKKGNGFELAAKGGALCKTCHADLADKRFVHAPVKDGDCFACHKPHGADGRFLLESDEDLSPLCLGCHDSPSLKGKFMHGPAAVGSCTECHDPHQSDQKGLLKGAVRDLCLKCHADFASAMHGAALTHAPVKAGPCTACHNPHGSAVVMFLEKKVPDLCVGCHKNIGNKLADAKVPHKPVKQEAGCSNCHASHFAASKGLLPLDEKSTCLSCHGTDTLGEPALHNIQKELEGKKFLHGPIKKGQCKACHDPHGSDHFRMLKGAYPKTIYNAYNASTGDYELCLKCHQRKMLQDDTTYTGFRNGTKNLHTLHVANNRKGRTCRVCHEPHASNGEKLLYVEGASFGDWKIPINFKSTSTGGSCAPGCHRAFSYDRKKPLPLPSDLN